MGILGSLRPLHWLGIGLIAVAIGTGAWTNVFGLLGGNTSEAKKLNSCLQRHHINPLNVAATMGMNNPLAMMSAAGGHHQQAVRAAVKHGKLESTQASSVLICMQKATR